jgi:carboxyl-terminal processing protease
MYKGLLEGVGDPYTYYFEQNELANFMTRTEGVYAGIGLLVTTGTEDRIVTVVNVFADTPAERAGIEPGDQIHEVEGTDVTSFRLEAVIDLIVGPPGTSVNITVYRPLANQFLDLDITRELISIPSVSHQMMDNDIGFIRIDQFDRATIRQFGEAFYELLGNGMQGLIIDVRNNPGGLMESVVQIADMILPPGIITYTEDKQGKRVEQKSGEDYKQVPMVILVNEGSASASEILGGAARDLAGSILVGNKTFGKGIVQNIFDLSDGSGIKVTTSVYFTPNGVNIHEEGLIPDYIVEVDREISWRAGSLSFDEDIQWQRAKEIMLGLIYNE